MQYGLEILCVILILVSIAILIFNHRSKEAGMKEDSDKSDRREPRKGLVLKLRHAGFSPKSSLLFFRILSVLTGILSVLLVSNFSDKIEYLPIAAIGGALLPLIYLNKRVKQRKDRIRRGLSLFVDLLTSLSRAGMTLEKTFTIAAREGFHPSHPIAMEVDLLHRELELGRERDEAFQLLADRTGVSELSVLASSIRMGIRSGAPVEDSLESQAEFLRFQQQEDAFRHLSKLASTSMIPVFLCGIPLWVIVVYFPLILEILETIKGLNPF